MLQYKSDSSIPVPKSWAHFPPTRSQLVQAAMQRQTKWPAVRYNNTAIQPYNRAKHSAIQTKTTLLFRWVNHVLKMITTTLQHYTKKVQHIKDKYRKKSLHHCVLPMYVCRRRNLPPQPPTPLPSCQLMHLQIHHWEAKWCLWCNSATRKLLLLKYIAVCMLHIHVHTTKYTCTLRWSDSTPFPYTYMAVVNILYASSSFNVPNLDISIFWPAHHFSARKYRHRRDNLK